MTCWECKNES